MSEPYVPDEVREFIINHIATVPQIEALLLIWSSPEKRWSLRQVAARIYTSEAEAARLLMAFVPGDWWLTKKEISPWIVGGKR